MAKWIPEQTKVMQRRGSQRRTKLDVHNMTVGLQMGAATLSAIGTVARNSEDGDQRITEDGQPRLLADEQYLLTEDGHVMLTEDGQPVLLEDALLDADGDPILDSDGNPILADFPWPATANVLLQALVTRERRVDDGYIVRALGPAWQAVIKACAADPDALHQLTPEQFEELVAASYDKAGYDEVILTPRSGDLGRDVIAIKHGWGSVRIVDQVKHFAKGHCVTARDVQALLGVLLGDQSATKGIVTTTSSFAPRIAKHKLIAPLVPYRLELVDGVTLARRLRELPEK